MRRQATVLGFVMLFGVMASVATSAQAPAAQAGGRGAAPAATPSSCGPNPPAALHNVVKDSRCFELRTYTLRPGGRGDLDLLHKRFREATLPYFKRHNMEVVGFWQPVSRPDTLIYLLAFKDAAARDAAWAAFQADPDWIKARNEMTVDLTVVNEFMIATDYGPVK